MSAENKTYALHKLSKIQSIDIVNAIENTGSRRKCFDLLQRFTDAIPNVLKVTLPVQIQSNEEFAIAIKAVADASRLLCSYQLSIAIEGLLIAHQDNNFMVVEKNLATLHELLTELCAQIVDAEAGTADEGLSSLEAKPEPAPTPTPAPQSAPTPAPTSAPTPESAPDQPQHSTQQPAPQSAPQPTPQPFILPTPPSDLDLDTSISVEHVSSQVLTQSQISKPKVAVRAADFQGIHHLIENFEGRHAVEAITKLQNFSYTEEIDRRLAEIHTALNSLSFSAAAEASKALAAYAAVVEGNSSEPVGKPRVVAIDDVADVISSLKMTLKDDYQVYGFVNQIVALKFLNKTKADLIILDIQMPNMDGFALLNRIRKMPAYEDTPILFLTSSQSAENVTKAIQSGANDYIIKPVDKSLLLSKLEKHLSK